MDRHWRGLILSLAGASGAFAVVAPAPRRPSEWKGWEARRAAITEIVVHIQQVFDLSKPSENNWLGRTANHLHVPSRELLVRRALLFKEGDPVSARDIYQTERLLRAMANIKEAHIVPEALPGGGVRAHVWVRDAWTLEVKMSYEQVGGQRAANFGIQDQNILGTGKTVGFSFAKDRERTDSQFLYKDPQLLGSRWQVSASYRNLSDGNAREFLLERPFFALNTPWSASIAAATRKSTLMIYEQSKSVYSVPFWANSARLASAWAIKQEDDRVWRAGVAFNADDRRYGPLEIQDPFTALPPPALLGRRQRGPALTLSYRQEAYESFQDIQGMDVAEDYNLTLEGDLELGTYTRRLGSTRPGSYVQLHLSNGWSAGPQQLTRFEGTVRTRLGRADGQTLLANAHVATYFQLAPNYQVAGYLAAAMSHDPDPENLDYIGGDQGLRGYPNSIHPGDAHWLASMEHRLFTEQRWWGLFRVGYVAFLDLGAVHRMNGAGWSPIYPGLGLGVRLGDLKSSLARVLSFTITVPLARQPDQNKYQLGISNTIQF